MSMYFNLKLPPIYQEVEYIQGTGSQYIRTGVTANINMKTELKINLQATDQRVIFGAKRELNGFFLMTFQDNLRWHSATAADMPCSTNIDYIIKTENGKMTVNGTDYNCDPSTSVYSGEIYLYRTIDYTNFYGMYKLYYMKIYDNNTLIRDFIPCYRKSDNVIGLYDAVNNQFYTNLGSGTFGKGANVNSENLNKLYKGNVLIAGGICGGERSKSANTLIYYNINDNDTEGDSNNPGKIYNLASDNYHQTRYKNTNGTIGTTTGLYTNDPTYGKVAYMPISNRKYTSTGSIINFGNNLSFISLIKVSATNSYRLSIFLEGATESLYPIGITINNEGKIEFRVSGYGGSYAPGTSLISESAIPTGQWIMIAATRSSNGEAKIYINGEIDKTGTLSRNPNYSTSGQFPGQLGRWRDGGTRDNLNDFFNGYMKFFIGENRVIPDSEILGLAKRYGLHQ